MFVNELFKELTKIKGVSLFTRGDKLTIIQTKNEIHLCSVNPETGVMHTCGIKAESWFDKFTLEFPKAVIKEGD
jgi:hypothetical protein